MKMSLDLKFSFKVLSEVMASVAGRADCCSMISLFLHKRATKDTKLTVKPSQMLIISFFCFKDGKISLIISINSSILFIATLILAPSFQSEESHLCALGCSQDRQLLTVAHLLMWTKSLLIQLETFCLSRLEALHQLMWKKSINQN